MPHLCRATCPEVAGRLLQRYLPELGLDGNAAPRVMRYHAGRSCAVAYQVGMPPAPAVVGELFPDERGQYLLALHYGLWREAFGPWAVDRIQVTRPLAYIPEMRMLVRSQVQGRPWETQLAEVGGETLARRYAQLLAKLHAARPEAAAHLATRTPASELAELTLALSQAPALSPAQRTELEALDTGLRRWAAHPPAGAVTPVLVYGDLRFRHILGAGPRLTLTSVETLALGDPALDVAYFQARLLAANLAGTVDLGAVASFGEEYARRRLVGTRFWRRVAFYETVAYLRLLGETPQPADVTAALLRRAAQCWESA